MIQQSVTCYLLTVLALCLQTASVIKFNLDGNEGLNSSAEYGHNTLTLSHFISIPPMLISSFHVSKPGQLPSWILHNFGKEAVVSPNSNNEFDLLNDGKYAFQNLSTTPKDFQSINCLFEFLANIVLDLSGKSHYPAVGAAWLSLHNVGYDDRIPCYYRIVYNHKAGIAPRYHKIATNLRTALIFCPKIEEKVCKTLLHSTPGNTVSGKIGLVNGVNGDTFLESEIFSVATKRDHSMTKADKAVCLVVPYSSSNDNRAVANKAILLEWIRHYSMLGFKVIIYDNHGDNYDSIFNNTVVNANEFDISYHPYTIRGLMVKGEQMKYDNEEWKKVTKTKKEVSAADESAMMRVIITDEDKMITLTHCRFEAKALYGIEDTLVVDADEFVYCPNEDTTLEAQKRGMERDISTYRSEGYNEFGWQRYTAANKAADSLECMLDRINRGISIFDCYASLRLSFAFPISRPKSFQIGFICPFTYHHGTCNLFDVGKKEHFDCKCKQASPHKFLLSNEKSMKAAKCALIHIVSNIQKLPIKPELPHVMETMQNESMSDMMTLTMSYSTK